MSEWLPIETAPRDGTEILLAAWIAPEDGLEHLFPAAWSMVVAQYEHGSVTRWQTVEKTPTRHVQEGEIVKTEGWLPDWIGEYATHWMPLPNPPAEQSA